jgi:hypothetical protein
MKNGLGYMKILREEIYKPYTEFLEDEGGMWEHIRVIDYEKLEREREEAIRERDETTRYAAEAVRRADDTTRHAAEAVRRADETTRHAAETTRRAEEAARKLLELGVSREQLATAGLLELAGE